MVQEVDIFATFAGVPAVGPEKKSNTKAQTKKKAVKTQIDIYSLPVSVETSFGVITMPASDEKKEVTESELLEYIAATHTYYKAAKIIKKDTRIGALLVNTGAAKGSVAVEDKTCMFFGTSEIDLSSIERGAAVEREHLIKLFKDQFPYMESENISFTVWSSDDKQILCIIADGNEVTEIPEPTDNVLIRLLNEEVIIISKNTYQDMLQKKREAEGEDAADILLSLQDLEEYLPEGIRADGHFAKLIAVAGKDNYLLCPLQAKVQTNVGSRTTYNIDGKIISLMFTQYLVTPDNFNNQVNVTESEIIDFLVQKGHREYKTDGISVTIKENPRLNTLIVIPSGSRKGSADDEINSSLKKQLYELEVGVFSTIRDGYRIYHAIRHPCFVALIQVGGVIAYFEWTAPKIPYTIWEQGYQLSKSVFESYGTEVMLDLYYAEEAGVYHWFIPRQKAGVSAVDTLFEAYLQSRNESGMIKVGQFHSHGRHPAFFSSQDDTDEVFPGIYGVWGSFADEPVYGVVDFKIRALIAQQQSVHISIEDIFALSSAPEDNSMFIEGWWDQIYQEDEQPADPGFQLCIVEVGGKVIRALLLEFGSQAAFYHSCKGISVYHIDDNALFLHNDQSQNNSSDCLIFRSSSAELIEDGMKFRIKAKIGASDLIDF